MDAAKDSAPVEMACDPTKTDCKPGEVCTDIGRGSPVCRAGCKSDAKGSALVTWVPAAVRAGAELREGCFATRVECDSAGCAARVVYVQDGVEQSQEAERIILACYSIETPRLLLNSASGAHPNGLANSSGMVGRNLMVHPASELAVWLPSSPG